MASKIENDIAFLKEQHFDTEGLKQKHKHFLNDNRIIMRLQQGFKSDKHNISSAKTNKIALSSKDRKGI